jgi:predicted ATP-grasp superfamily ATP-dependent carboligase
LPDDQKSSLESRRRAFVIGSNDTAISAAWCLADAGVGVCLFCLDPGEIGRHSRRVQVVDLTDLGTDQERICEYIAWRAKADPLKPVLLPCGDPESLMLARFHALLEGDCCTSSLSHDELLNVVSKNRLYAAALNAGVAIPPTIISPASGELADWLQRNPPPYLAKPYYLGLESSSLRRKNRIFETAAELFEFIDRRGASAVIIQQFVHGGDGAIFDCYGFSDRHGRIVTKASHRRIRQHPIHRGVTCFGEIPSSTIPGSERAIFELTDRLLSHVRYHGIFGIEWALCRDTEDYYLLDFNARPFLTIRHLMDCGLNLPFIAFEEMAGRDVTGVSPTPRLKHKYWLDFSADVRSFKQHREKKEISTRSWIASLFRSRSFSVASMRDPVPTAVRAGEVVLSLVQFALRRLR